jgi:hypothetical protein
VPVEDKGQKCFFHQGVSDAVTQRKNMLTINTTRFGELEIEEKRVIHFPEGLIGFPGQKKIRLFRTQTRFSVRMAAVR